MGGRECYRAELYRAIGTCFMIPGWSFHWRRMFKQEYGHLSVDMAKRLFRHYERSPLVSTPVMAEEGMGQDVNDFNDLF